MAAALLTAAFLAGLALVSYGAWMAWHPAGLLVGGCLLIVVPILHARGAAWGSSTP